MRSILLLAALLAGCTTSDPEPRDELGQVRLCLETQVDPVAVDALDRWDLHGTITEVQSLAPGPAGTGFGCVVGKGRLIDLVDDDDQPWRIGWTATSADVDRSPELTVDVGDEVDVTFAHLNDFADDSFLVIADADGVLFAGEEGYGARIEDVDPGLIDGLSVERGDASPTLLYTNDCGRFTPQSLTFSSAGTTLELQPWADGSLPVGGVLLQARNVGASAYLGEVTCTDTWRPMPWIVWR